MDIQSSSLENNCIVSSTTLVSSDDQVLSSSHYASSSLHPLSGDGDVWQLVELIRNILDKETLFANKDPLISASKQRYVLHNHVKLESLLNSFKAFSHYLLSKFLASGGIDSYSTYTPPPILQLADIPRYSS